MVIRLKLEVGIRAVEFFVYAYRDLGELDFVGLGHIHAVYLNVVEGCTHAQAAGHGNHVVQREAAVEGDGGGLVYGTADPHFADIGVGGVVVYVQVVTGLQEHFTVCLQVDWNVLHFLGVGDVLAEDVGDRVDRGLYAAGQFDGLRYRHAVVEAETAGEGTAHLSVHGDGGHVTVAGLLQDGDGIAGFQLEVRIAVDAREGDGEHLQGLVRARTLHDDNVRAGGITRLGALQQGDKAAVVLQVVPARIIDIAAYVHILLQGGVGLLDEDDVAGQHVHNLAAGHDVRQLEFQQLRLVVHEAVDLHVIRIGILLEAAGVINEVNQAFPFHELIAHGAFDGALDVHHFLGHGNKKDVVVLEVIVGTVCGVHHVFVQVQGVGFSATGELDVTDGTLGGGAAGCCQGVEHRVEGADGEAALNAHLAVDVHVEGTGRADGHGNLVRAEGIVLGQFGLDGGTGLGQGEAFEENLGGAGGLDGAVRAHALVDFRLGRTEDGDVDFIAFSQDIGIRRLGAVRGAVHVQGFPGEQGVTVDVVAGGRGHVVRLQSLLQCLFCRSFSHGGLGKVCR